jgi:hypothetical protein
MVVAKNSTYEFQVGYQVTQGTEDKELARRTGRRSESLEERKPEIKC